MLYGIVMEVVCAPTETQNLRYIMGNIIEHFVGKFARWVSKFVLASARENIVPICLNRIICDME